MGTPQACSLQAETCALYNQRSVDFISTQQQGQELLIQIKNLKSKCQTIDNLRDLINSAQNLKITRDNFLQNYNQVLK
ncbi:MAG: hypothetical protein PHS07_03285 [Patescibacteria group bacterium]|nr:hypothetical protein [Patescibacteria group bacterium]